MSEPPVADDPGNAPVSMVAAGGEPPNGDAIGNSQLTSDKLQVGDVISEALLVRLAKLEKYEHKLAEVARVYRNLNTARKAVETVLKRLTPVQSIAEVEELEAHLSNLNNKSQYAGEQIGALTELDKANRAKISDLETQLNGLRAAEQGRQALAKDLDKLTKERKVVEGQLERSNQKLRLDVKALDAAKAELEAKLAESLLHQQTQEEASMDVDTLAARLSAELSADSDSSSSASAGSEPLRALQAQLVDKCGVPEGLVLASEVENATARVSESHVQELAQLKDILRKELAASEDRLQTVTTESDAAIAELRRQLSEKETPRQQTAEEEGELLTAERAGEIVAAALANRLEMTTTTAMTTSGSGGEEKDEAHPPPQASAGQADTAASKKKGKKKRKGTGASSSVSAAPSPAAPVPARIAVDDSMAPAAPETVKATSREISQLVALLETLFSAPQAKDGDDDSCNRLAELAEAERVARQQLSDAEARHAAAIADLQAQLDQSGNHAQQALDALQASNARVAELAADVQAKAQRIGELEAEIQSAKAKSEAMSEELQAKDARIDELAAEIQSAAAKSDALASELQGAKAKADAFGEERARLAQALAKAQGGSVRLEAQQAELKAQVTSLTSELHRATAKSDALGSELRAAEAKSDADHAARAGAEAQLAQTAAAVAGLEEHVRAVDADLANSRAQFADKSRAAAQAAAQAQELQYALEKERRAARAAAEDAAKQAAGAQAALAAAQAEADAQREASREEADALRRRLAELDHSHAHASRADRLEAQHAERQAELETMRQSLQRAEDAQTALRVEADRLRDVERELGAANERLTRVTDERALSEQRWKR
ncbi:hypothetical protein GGI00_002584, partial [Coemansia sp. RSA 2681]